MDSEKTWLAHITDSGRTQTVNEHLTAIVSVAGSEQSVLWPWHKSSFAAFRAATARPLWPWPRVGVGRRKGYKHSDSEAA